MKVSVITATTGRDTLRDAINGVARQDYADLEHLVVVDGPEHSDKVAAVLAQVPDTSRLKLTTLPHPTGKNRYNGHRIYGGFSFLASGEFVLFLDEDNFQQPNHVSSLVALVQQHKLDWAYALRNIYSNDEFVCRDECESLGQWPSVLHPEDRMVDANCYFLRTMVAVKTASVWYRQARTPGQATADRSLYPVLARAFPRFGCTGQYTLNYRVASTEKSVRKEFFEQGNAIMAQRYPQGRPWAGVSLSPGALVPLP